MYKTLLFWAAQIDIEGEKKLKNKNCFTKTIQIALNFFVLVLCVFVWKGFGQANNMSGRYIGNGNVPITLSSCTDPDDNGDIMVTSRTLSITETNSGTFTGSLNLTASTDDGLVSATFAINGTAPLGNPRTLSGTMQSQTPPLTLLNGNFSGSWSQSGSTINITINLSGRGSTGDGL